MITFTSKFYVALAVALYLTILSVQNVRADEPSAEEIVAKSLTAMSQPLQYTLISNGGGEMLVYQKILPDGSNAMLTNYPATKRMSIVYGKKHYDIRLEHQVAIDMSSVMQGMQDRVASWTSDLNDKTSKKTYELVEIIKHNDRDCYVIFETISLEFKEAIWNKISENMKNEFPAKKRFLIDKENYLMQERETLTEEGVTLSKVEYKDIRLQPDLSDDFFQLPPGLEVLYPQSTEEYTAIVTDRLMPNPPRIDVETEFKKIKEEVREKNPLRPRRDVRKKAEEATRQFREQAELTKERVLAREEYPLLETSSDRWIVFVAVNGIGILLILAIFFFRWYYRSR